MTFSRVHVFAAILSGLCACTAPGSAAAQSWPAAKPITIVVPVPPGPTIDQLARIVASKLQDVLGQTVIVDNRSGANGMIGSAAVAHAPPASTPRMCPTAA